MDVVVIPAREKIKRKMYFEKKQNQRKERNIRGRWRVHSSGTPERNG